MALCSNGFMLKKVDGSPSLTTIDHSFVLGARCLIALNGVNLTVLYEDYKNQIFDPTNIRIISFHNQAGEIRPGTVTIADAQVLKPTGGMDAATAAARPTSARHSRNELHKCQSVRRPPTTAATTTAAGDAAGAGPW